MHTTNLQGVNVTKFLNLAFCESKLQKEFHGNLETPLNPPLWFVHIH